VRVLGEFTLARKMNSLYTLWLMGWGKDELMGLMGFNEYAAVKGLGLCMALPALLSVSACANSGPKAATKQQDPNIKCKPTYTQVYQPPLKLGGTGRVIVVPSGEKCEMVNS